MVVDDLLLGGTVYMLIVLITLLFWMLVFGVLGYSDYLRLFGFFGLLTIVLVITNCVVYCLF